MNQRADPVARLRPLTNTRRSSAAPIEVYTDGACAGNPGPGGWAALVVDGAGTGELSGREDNTTNNRMEIMAAIKGLEATPEGASVTVFSDSQYLVYTMTRNWKRKANTDLWRTLDKLVATRQVSWQWLRGHQGHPLNERANLLANEMAARGGGQPVGPPDQAGAAAATTSAFPEPAPPPGELTHLGAQGQARMVDISEKATTAREAVAKGRVVMRPETLRLIREGALAKGDVLAVARLAGIMAAKKTPELIPLAHPLFLSQVTVDLELDQSQSCVEITARAKTAGQTGVEMEALVAVAAAALTIYDMAKAVDRQMRIQDIRLVSKRGGRSGPLRQAQDSTLELEPS